MTKPSNKDDLKNRSAASEDYLWDPTGSRDAEIERLESVLADFRYKYRPLVLPAENPAVSLMPRPTSLRWLPRLAAAAVLLTLSLGAYFLVHRAHPADPGPAWNVVSLEGAPQIDSRTISVGASTAKFRVGDTLTTNSSSRASITEPFLGQIYVDPGSRVHLLQSSPNFKRIQLEVGTIHAAIWAPPAQFIVDTPSASAVDLGCRYTLQVAPDGSGTLRTTMGWVGFHLNGRDSFIPAGAICTMRPEAGPGTPFFEDASANFRDAVEQFDRAAPSGDVRSRQLETILREARPRDELTLWHLLSRTTGPQREQVYARLSALIPPPVGVTREGVLQLDPHMMDLYWNALDLGDISVWRFWEQLSGPQATPASQQPLPKKQM
jgi:hypothetical protein